MTQALHTVSSYIEERTNAFLSLWTHRYDYIYAEHPVPGEKPEWRTEARHPLSDRLIEQGAYLYGVRFAAETRYCVLDIDFGSAYHPSSDGFAVGRILQALEPLGFVEAVICSSSYSQGLHVYLPFEKPQRSWEIALAVTTLLENAGFKPAPGILEVFPNPKPFSSQGEQSLYNAHRLPLQEGSYLLNHDFHPVWSTRETFVKAWRFTEQKNDLDSATLKETLKRARRKTYRISSRAEKFLNDLNAEIEHGWTGQGQTNRLLGRIAMRSYVFGHILYADRPLEGAALADDIAHTARSLPGFTTWCNHQQELEEKSTAWARSIEGSHYFHYGYGKLNKAKEAPAAKEQPSWNEIQQTEAREKIKNAVISLQSSGALPTGITARFEALIDFGISGATLYRHRDLWHPRHLLDSLWKTPSDSPTHKELPEDVLQRTSSGNHPSLLTGNGCNTALEQDSDALDENERREIGCNTAQDGPKGIGFVLTILNRIKQNRHEGLSNGLERESSSLDDRTDQAHQARMRRYLDSGDPILEREAERWFRRFERD
ncbi:hypothetical protein H6G00_06270 [Leptolyngbya sp. FACHB-541]|uniref:hypothetical protein n=1 Tax=Leptolyngbya sp. FACHB-541 TaxID=2692810 RepID=UPI001682CB4D|nr:hypothetical protein [Leptolyngbya sp. FACHB-541]MBD1996224.1 hypothetical protein [Leptolyngbya sp. FACHB-541]